MGTHYFNQTQAGKKQQDAIIKELVHGQQFTSQLQLLFVNNQYPTVNELLRKISTSFADAISALCTTVNGIDENLQSVSHGEQQSSAGSGPFEEDSGESRKRPPPAGKSGAAGRDNRGTYKRRKSCNSRIIVSSLTQDGHAWRKYGQKEILHAKFPRSYYRCTHKFDQGCKATKQVQQLEQEKEMYSITYLGHHTCRNNNALTSAAALPPPAATAVEAESIDNEPSATVSVKQEVSNNEESPSGVTVDHNDEMMVENDGNVNMWQDFVSFDLEAEEAVSNYGYDYGNYDYSGNGGVSNSPILDLDFSVKNIDFDGGFQFDSEQSCGFF
ncbi:unnamed protein product [Linum tenue]|uniref:WRKY domain-containing protein n=1 Tax=Linum tenue TaxID=586396 RepID=A0AAV0NKR4_9ROSI|nr:unnamed protein product [Linum tenue]